MKIIAIVAVAKDFGIGKDNRLLWRLPADMKFFKEQTTGFSVITGRKNYESIPENFRPLPQRENIVITRQKAYHAPGAKVFNDIESALKYLKGQTKVFVIGGGQIYEDFLSGDLVDEILITHVDGSFDADVFFPKIQPEKWSKELLFTQQKDDKNAYAFEVYRYTKK